MSYFLNISITNVYRLPYYLKHLRKCTYSYSQNQHTQGANSPSHQRFHYIFLSTQSGEGKGENRCDTFRLPITKKNQKEIQQIAP